MSEFSVVIPVRNGGARLDRAVRSALHQRPAPARVVVVDDRSTDGAPEAVAQALPEVEVVAAEAPGPGEARNTGLRHCGTAWVAFLDADDRWLPGHLADLTEVRRAYPHAVLIATGYSWVVEPAPDPEPAGAHLPQEVDYLRRAALDPGFVWTGAAAVDRLRALDCGGFGSVQAGEDLMLWVRLALAGPVAWTPRRSAVYVRGTGGIMESRALMAAGATRDVADLNELSRALGVAADALAAGSPDSDALREYINGRVSLAAIGALVAGDVPGMLRLRQLRVPGPSPRPSPHWLAMAAEAPAPILPVVASVISRAARWRRSRRGGAS